MKGPDGHDTCVPCFEGYYNPKAGALECSKCPVDTYANSKHSLQCTSCPSGKGTKGLEGSTDVSACIDGADHAITTTPSPNKSVNNSGTDFNPVEENKASTNTNTVAIASASSAAGVFVVAAVALAVRKYRTGANKPGYTPLLP